MDDATRGGVKKNGMGIVTPQTQKGPKHEKYIPRVPIDFSFLENQTIGDLSFPQDKNI